MSIKNLFGKKSLSVSNSEKSATAFDEVESIDYVKEYSEGVVRFIPSIDYEDPANFAKYGLAEKYYVESIEHIHKTYPYDGSAAEKQRWKNSNSDIVNYLYDNVYPRNTGYKLWL